MTVVDNPRIKYRVEGGWVDVLTGLFAPIEFPNDTNVGVDAITGWTPASTIGTPDALELVQYNVPGGVLEDTRIYGSLAVTAPHVRVRRCEIIDGTLLNDYGNQISNDLIVEDTTIRLSDPGVNTDFTLGYSAVTSAGFTLRRCAVLDTTEGPRTGGSIAPLRDPDVVDGYHVKMYDTYIRITGPHPCSPTQGLDYHGDGIQTYDSALGGVPLTMRNCTIYSIDQQTTPPHPTEPYACGGTSCIISGLHQSMAMDIDRLLMSGAAYSFVVESGGRFSNLYVDENNVRIGPISVPPEGWDLIDEPSWTMHMCTVDTNGQPSVLTASVPHGYPGFGPLDPP